MSASVILSFTSSKGFTSFYSSRKLAFLNTISYRGCNFPPVESSQAREIASFFCKFVGLGHSKMAFAFEGSGSTYLDDIKKPKNITIGIINEHRFKFMYSFS